MIFSKTDKEGDSLVENAEVKLFWLQRLLGCCVIKEQTVMPINQLNK